jgi:hypothetical protein
VYYADVNGVWTDNSVNNTTAGDPRNHNVPEDGKFDQGFIPTDVELQTGRVDFDNMPAFSLSELELLRNYLNKDHAYRHKKFVVEHRAVVDDNFGFFGGEAFAGSGYKNAAPLVGYENVITADYFFTLADSSYLWSYGCGGGWYQGASGIGSTSDFAVSDLQSVFTMLFGSYFGDWDTPNNFLRAPLAQGKTLTNVWSGRPHWQFHHMGLGENIGYDVRLSQNNSTLYFSNFGGRVVHMAFMGDPTLRNHIVSPPSNVVATTDGSDITIEWTASEEEVLGYHVYVKGPSSDTYERWTQVLVDSTLWSLSCLEEEGLYSFMVRAMVLQVSPSGTYYNLSQGSTFSIYNTPVPAVIADATFDAEGDIVQFTNASSNATYYLWDFGDGNSGTMENPVHDFVDGEFIVTLIAGNECWSDTTYFTISILTAIENAHDLEEIILYPNPAERLVYVKNIPSGLYRVSVNDMHGRMISENKFDLPGSIPVSGLVPGSYRIQISNSDRSFKKQLIIR